MNPALDPTEIILLRQALASLRAAKRTITDFGSRYLQGTAQTTCLVVAGDHVRELDALDYRLREELARLTGTPHIQHGNADIHDTSDAAMTFAAEAQEANLRG